MAAFDASPCIGDRRLADLDPELEQLGMDPGRAPEWIGQAHLADQTPDFERDLVLAMEIALSRGPAEQPKPGAMSTDDCVWFDDRQGVDNPGRDPRESGKD